MGHIERSFFVSTSFLSQSQFPFLWQWLWFLPVLCIITFNTMHTSFTYVRRFHLPIPDLRCFFFLSFRPTSLRTCPQGYIWWDCSCLILLPSLWSVINFLLIPSLPVLPSLFQSRILRKKNPKVSFLPFFFFFFLQSDTLTAFLPDSIPLFPLPALIFSPACIQRKRRRSHSSTHDWPQPVSQTFLRGGRRQRGRGCCRHNRGIHQPTICGQWDRWFLPNSVLRLTALLAGP